FYKFPKLTNRCAGTRFSLPFRRRIGAIFTHGNSNRSRHTPAPGRRGGNGMITEQEDVSILTGAEWPRMPLSPDGVPAPILVVDDNPAKLKAITAIVTRMGLEVSTATSGTEALRQLLKRDFAVILLDVKMPVMDGFETA